MEIKKGYKMTDVGVIPEDWEVKSIGEICCDSKYGVAAEAIPYDGCNKYIRITDIDDEDGHFIQSNLTSPSFFMPIHILVENDLLVARTGASVGKSYLYNKQDGKLIYAGFLMKFNINRANPKLIFYKTMTSDYHDYIESESMRSGQPGVNIQQIKDYAISLPTLIKEQQAIADALTKVDNLIMSLSKVIEKKKLIKKGTMQKLLSGEVRLDGFEGKIKSVYLSETGEIKAGGTPSTNVPSYWGGTINWLQSGAVKNRVLEQRDVEKHITEEGLECSSAYIIRENSVLIAITGATCGNIAYLPFKSAANQSVVAIQVNESFNSKYIFYMLIQNSDKIINNRGGSAQGGVSVNIIKEIELNLHEDVDEQSAIANVLTTMDDEIEKLEKERDKYKSIKQGMMQQLLTGKIRLTCQ